MNVINIEHARQLIEGLTEFLTHLKDDEDPGEEGLSIADIDDALALLASLNALLRKR